MKSFDQNPLDSGALGSTEGGYENAFPNCLSIMKPYDFDEAQYFKGRRQEIHDVTRQLESLSSTGVGLLLISGASGVGKTSLIYGGLLPSLAHRDRGLYWVGIRPKDHAKGFFHALVEGLSKNELFESSLSSESARDQLAFTLRGRGEEAASQIGALLAQDRRHVANAEGIITEVPQSNLVIVVDSLEQLADLEKPEIDVVLTCIHDLAANHRITVIGALRSPFFSLCEQRLKHQGHFYELKDVTDMGLQEIVDASVSLVEKAIPQPGEHRELRRKLYHQIQEVPELLPFMAPMMAEMIRECRADSLGSVTGIYDQLGGILGGMGKHSERVFSLMRPSVQSGFDVVMQSLFEREKGSTNLSANEGALRSQASLTPDGKLLTNALIDAAILRVRGVTAESANVRLVHSGLIHQWDRLREWVDRETSRLELCVHLQQSADKWRRERRQPEFLIDDPKVLADAKLLMDDGYERLDQLTLDYVAESLLLVENEEEKQKAGHGLGFSLMLLGFAVAMAYGAFRHLDQATSRPKPKNVSVLNEPRFEPSRPMMEVVRPSVKVPKREINGAVDSQSSSSEDRAYPAVEQILKTVPEDEPPTGGKVSHMDNREVNQLMKEVADFHEEAGEDIVVTLKDCEIGLAKYSDQLIDDPSNTKALIGKINMLERMAAHCLKLGKIVEATGMLSESFEMRTNLAEEGMRVPDPDSRVSNLFFYLGAILQAYGDESGYGIALQGKFVRSLPEKKDPLPSLNRLLARVQYFGGNGERALASWKNADVVTDGMDARVEIGRILSLIQLGDESAAVKRYRNLIRIDDSFQIYSTIDGLAWPQTERAQIQKIRTLAMGQMNKSLGRSPFPE